MSFRSLSKVIFDIFDFIEIRYLLRFVVAVTLGLHLELVIGVDDSVVESAEGEEGHCGRNMMP